MNSQPIGASLLCKMDARLSFGLWSCRSKHKIDYSRRRARSDRSSACRKPGKGSARLGSLHALYPCNLQTRILSFSCVYALDYFLFFSRRGSDFLTHFESRNQAIPTRHVKPNFGCCVIISAWLIRTKKNLLSTSCLWIACSTLSIGSVTKKSRIR